MTDITNLRLSSKGLYSIDFDGVRVISDGLVKGAGASIPSTPTDTTNIRLTPDGSVVIGGFDGVRLGQENLITAIDGGGGGTGGSGPHPPPTPLIVVITDVAKGDLTVYQNGGFLYNYTGSGAPDTDSFTYELTDADGTSNIATVSLTISAPPAATVPDIVGLTSVAATTALLAEGLIPGTITGDVDPVVSQDPASGTSTVEGAAVDYALTSAGNEELYLGDTLVTELYLGNTSVTEMYLGDTKVF